MDPAGIDEWVIDEAGGEALAESVLVQEVRHGSVRRSRASQFLAVRILDVIVHNNRRMFGEAAIRIDALVVVHGGSGGDKLADFYAPGTFRFDRIADGDHLPIRDPASWLSLAGLVIF